MKKIARENVLCLQCIEKFKSREVREVQSTSDASVRILQRDFGNTAFHFALRIRFSDPQRKYSWFKNSGVHLGFKKLRIRETAVLIRSAVRAITHCSDRGLRGAYRKKI